MTALFHRVHSRAGLVIVGALFMTLGCSHIVDPFQDDLAGEPPVTTPSVEAALAAQTVITPSDRGFEEVVTSSHADGVEHGPLYFEDGFEDKGSDDGKFAWTFEDYWQFLYWRARFGVNLIALPISFITTPPWQKMVSNGELEEGDGMRPYDAQRLPKQEPAEPEAEPMQEETSETSDVSNG
jgi:hypothetical protein